MNDFGKDNNAAGTQQPQQTTSPTSPEGYFYGFSYGGSNSDNGAAGGINTGVGLGSNSKVNQEDFLRTASPEEMQPLKDPDPEDAPPGMVALTDISGSGGGGGGGKGNNNNDGISQYAKSKHCEDFDEILDMIGSEGKFQKILLYAVLCPIVTVSPFLLLNTVFMWDTPDHFCHVPGRDLGMPLEEWKNLTLPWYAFLWKRDST